MEEYNQMIKYMKLQIEKVDTPLEELQETYLQALDRGFDKNDSSIVSIRLKIEYLKGQQQAHLDILSDTVHKRDRFLKQRSIKKRPKANKWSQKKVTIND